MLDRVIRFGPFAGLLLLFSLPSAMAHLVGSWWGFLPFLLLFAAFAASLLGWGGLFSRKFGLGFAGTLLFASAVAVGGMYLAGALGILAWRPLFFLFLAGGAWLFPASRPRLREPNWWVLGIFGFVTFVRVFSAFLPQAHGDPLLYHLASPRLWLLQGGVHLVPDLPIAILSATWEYFYLWPQVLWDQTANVEHLVAAQVLCQWIHLLWGWLGAAILVERLTRERLHGSRWGFLFPLAALFPASLQWTAGVAKNDAGVAFWGLGAWWLAQEARRSGRGGFWALAGLFAGMAVTGKISVVLFLAPALFVVLAEEGITKRRLPWRETLLLGGVFALALLPIYGRNWLETANPFFPMFPKFFPSPWITESWKEHFSDNQPGQVALRSGIFFTRLRELARESPLNFGWLLLPFALFLRRSRHRLRPWADWFAVSLLSFAIFIFAFTLNAEIRYLGPALILLALCGLVGYLAVADALPAPYGRAARWIALVAILAASKVPTHLLWKFPRMAPGRAFLLTHTAGDAKAWLRGHVPPGALVVMMGDNESYYLLGMRVTVLTERPDLDRATKGVRDLRDFVHSICSLSGATYLLESRMPLGLGPRFPGADFSAAIAYQGLSSRVYDLRRLESSLFPGRANECGRIPAPVYGISSASLSR